MPVIIDERAVQPPRSAESVFDELMRAKAREHQSLIEGDPRTTPELPPERQRLAEAGILHLSPIVRQVVDLWKEPESDDFGRLRPTQHAFDLSVSLLVDTAIEAFMQRRPIPHACVSTDSEGGVRVEWVRHSASVHLVVPANEQQTAYIYHEINDNYETEDATRECLAHWLQQID